MDVIDGTGGHLHIGSGRPRGSVLYPGRNTTDDDGYLPFTFYAPSPAGDHLISARCRDRDCGEWNGKIWVGIQGLQSLYDTYLYQLVGSKTVHPQSHYLTLNVTGSVVWLAELYLSEFKSDPVLHYNDASLERGGLFDISANWSTGPWGHQSHRRGDIIDVRANPAVNPDTAIPERNFLRFEEFACEAGGRARIHSPNDPNNQHFHIEFHGCVPTRNTALIEAHSYVSPMNESPSTPAPPSDPCAGPNPDPTQCY